MSRPKKIGCRVVSSRNENNMATKRTVHIDGQPWQYLIGGSGIKFFFPNSNEVRYIRYGKIYPGLDVERAQWKRNFHVQPSHVKNFIIQNLL